MCVARPGKNLDFDVTNEWCLDNHMRISVWGAYQICPELYAAALQHIDLLESGKVRFKLVDSGYRSDRVSNCIHAASSIADGYRLRVASPGYGEVASYAVLQRYEKFIIDRARVHPWVGSALGLDQYPMIYRDWQAPRSGAFFGPAYRLFGGERDLVPTYGPPAP